MRSLEGFRHFGHRRVERGVAEKRGDFDSAAYRRQIERGIDDAGRC